ncbi:MAG: serine/threonine protein kinase, partial [Planctomycetota bacterium]
MSEPQDSWILDASIPEGTRQPPGSARHARQGLAALSARYRILGELGRGGMGVVYRAQDRAGRDVALKVLGGRLNPASRARFRREAELTARLRHPGIVRVHDAGEVGGVPFVAYELVSGGRTLDLASRDLDREARVRLLAEAARALGHAHAQGLVHRDVKPENVLVDPEGKPHLADFGLAWSGGADRLTRTGAFVGTPSYMAPEQFDGSQTGPPAPSADVWSLGVMLYELLAGVRPFEGSTLIELAARIRDGDYPPLRSRDPSLPRALEAVCAKALAVRPEERYPDAGALAADLEAYLRGEAVSASGTRSVAVFVRRHRRRVLLVPLVVGLLGLALVGAREGWQALTARRIATLCRKRVLAPAERRELEDALAEAGDLPLRLRARGHLALARGGGNLSAWRERLAHARRAAEIAPTPELQRECAKERARLHALLGEPSAAAEALGAVSERALRPDLLALRTRLLLEAKEATSAAEVARRLVALRGGLDDRLLLVEALSAARERARAEKALAALGDGFQRALGEALLAERSGGSPLLPLEEAVRRWPRRPELRVALARHLLRVGQAWAAWDVLEGAAEEGGVRGVRKLIAALLPRPDAARLSALGPEARGRAAEVLLAEAERELAFAWAGEDPRRRGEEAVLPRERRRRARGLLALAESLCRSAPQRARALRLRALASDDPGERERAVAEGLELAPHDSLLRRLRAEALTDRGKVEAALAALPPPGRTPESADEDERCALLRGALLVRAGRPEEALQVLEPLSRDLPEVCRALAAALAATGRTGDAASLEARAERIEQPKVVEAERVLDELIRRDLFRGADCEVVRRELERRIDPLDPLCYPARCRYEFRLVLQPTGERRTEGLRLHARTLRRAPNLMGYTSSLLLVASRATAVIERLGGVTRLAEAQRDFVENSGPDRFLRALFE